MDLSKTGYAVKMHGLQMVGLIFRKGDEMLADSPVESVTYEIRRSDGSISKKRGAVEIKTMTAVRTIAQAVSKRDSTGRIVELPGIGNGYETDALFKKVVPNPAYRLQCLHHAIVLGAEKVIFVVAKGAEMSIGGVIHTVVLIFSETFLRNYEACLLGIKRSYFGWIGGPSRNILE